MGMKTSTILLLFVTSLSMAAWPQSTYPGPAVTQADLAIGYTNIYANAPPGAACGCFWMQGGSAQFAVSDHLGVGLLFDFGMTTASHIGSGTGYQITLATYLAGGRYSYRSRSRFTPYGQVLVGAAHSSTNNVQDNGSTTIAFSSGAGLDFRIRPRLSWRVVQGEYLRTTIPNGANNLQNQTRLTSGIVLHLK
jgi:outer membrane immunogenic protein